MNFSYSERLKADLARWQSQGLIDGETQKKLLAELAARQSGWSFSTIIALLGVICLCFAAMSFVAANWTDIPRIGRVGLIFATLWLAYGGAIWSYGAGRTAIAQTLVLLGCGIFGAGIMLVGQMYHLQGNAADAVLVWALGTMLAAIGLRAIPALCLAILLLVTWLLMDSGFELDEAAVSWLFPLALGVLAATAYWLHSRFAAHLLTIAGLIWIVHGMAILTAGDESFTYALSVYTLMLAVFAGALLSLEQGPMLRGFEAAMLVYVLCVVLLMTALWAAQATSSGNLSDTQSAMESTAYWPSLIPLLVVLLCIGWAIARQSEVLYDLVFTAIWTGVAIGLATPIGLTIPFAADALMLGLSVWMIRMGDRHQISGVRRLGYVGFAAVLLMVYFRTVGSLFGGTIFYATIGVVMVAGAIILPRLWRKRQTVEEKGS